jgi:hypothetical protein
MRCKLLWTLVILVGAESQERTDDGGPTAEQIVEQLQLAGHDKAPDKSKRYSHIVDGVVTALMDSLTHAVS